MARNAIHMLATSGAPDAGSFDAAAPHDSFASFALSPIWRSSIGIVVLCLFWLGLAAHLDQETAYAATNAVIPLVLLVTCIFAAYRLVSRNKLALWSPFPWFLVAFAVYFCFGPLLYVFALDDVLDMVHAYYYVSRRDLFVANAVNYVGLLFVLMGALTMPAMRRLGWSLPPMSGNDDVFSDTQRIRTLVYVLLAVGLPAKYLFTLPYRFGLMGDAAMPGIIGVASGFVSVSLIPLSYLIWRGHLEFRLHFYLVLLSELFYGFIALSKYDVVMTLLTAILGRYLSQPRMKVLFGGVAIVFIVFTALAPFVSQARSAFGGAIDASNVGAGFRSFQQVNEDLVEQGDFSYLFSVWARLSLTNAQAFAINEYDTGRNGESFELAFYTVIPRFAWEDKPIITIGDKFNESVTGSRESASGPGFFAEAYWNGGWGFVVGAGFFVGMLLAVFSSFSLVHMSRGWLGAVPVVMMAMTVGMRPDNWFVANFVGLPVQMVAVYVALRAVGLFRARRR
jgi:hypothetical protein